MKTIIAGLVKQTLIGGLLVIIVSSCSYQPTNSDNFGNTGSVLGLSDPCVAPIGCQIEDIMKSHSWKLTFFNKSGQDNTLIFKENIFQFTELFLSPTSGIENLGSWDVLTNDKDKENYLLVDFVFVIDLLNEFEALDNHWSIDSYSKNKIELSWTNSETGNHDYLTFEKK